MEHRAAASGDGVAPPRVDARGGNLVAAASFVAGGSLFAVGAVLAQLDLTSLVTVNITYLVGGVFFSLGGYVSILIAPPHQLQWRSAVVLFIGTLLFAVSLVAAFAVGLTPRQSNGWIWLPDISGCVCFLVSGHLAMLAVGDGRVRVRPAVLGWWVVAVNQLGSVLFFLAGLAAFTRPTTSEAVDAGLVNWGTFAGAVCFAAGGLVQALDTPAPTENGGSST
jgi:hypothetical protein